RPELLYEVLVEEPAQLHAAFAVALVGEAEGSRGVQHREVDTRLGKALVIPRRDRDRGEVVGVPRREPECRRAKTRLSSLAGRHPEPTPRRACLEVAGAGDEVTPPVVADEPLDDVGMIDEMAVAVHDRMVELRPDCRRSRGSTHATLLWCFASCYQAGT